jgi:hypothetical protein
MCRIKIIAFIFIAVANDVNAQVVKPASGGSKKALVMEQIGITDVTIDYYRPAVNGREGKIFGDVVHYGFADLGFGTTKEAPWRAGANENTTIEFSKDVKIEGKLLPAGKYGFFIAMGKEKATIIFSRHTTAWGSFYYNPKDDALRAEVPVLKTNEMTERLKFEFSDQTEESALLSLLWEKTKIPFTIVVDLKKDQLEAYRKAMTWGKYYIYWQNMRDAANFCLVNNMNLEEGLQWAERSITDFFGETNFLTLSTYSGLLEKLSRKKEADSVMQKALPMATTLQLYSYGGTLVKMKQAQRAHDVYKMGYDRSPKDGYAVLGMIRGAFAIGDKKEALRYADMALAIWEDSNSKAFINKMIDDIKAGKDINK